VFCRDFHKATLRNFSFRNRGAQQIEVSDHSRWHIQIEFAARYGAHAKAMLNAGRDENE
jgi:hypothetical protein